MKIAEVYALTGVRGFAALWVVVMHYTWGAGRGGEGIWYQIAEHGFAGVIIFLVLSGYILSHVYSPTFSGSVERQGYASYLYKRLARIYPLHLITIAAFAMLAVLGVPVLSGNENWATLILNLLLIQAWGFVNAFSWNALSWTISVEMFAYLWIPFLLCCLFRLPRIAAAILLAALVWFLKEGYFYKLAIAAGLDLTNLNLRGGHFLVQFSAVIAGGVALYRIASGVALPSWASSALTLAGLAILCYACTVPLQNWLMMSGAAVLIVGLKDDIGVGRVIFGNPVSVFLGNISYALYLTHMLLNISIEHYYPAMPLPWRIVVAIAVASAVYHGFERPAQAYLRSLWRPTYRPVTA